MTQRSYIMALDSLEGLGPMAIQSLVATYPMQEACLAQATIHRAIAGTARQPLVWARAIQAMPERGGGSA